MVTIFRSKKGIELAINFIVTFILAIVLFALGIALAVRMLGGGSELTSDVIGDFDKRVIALSCSGSDVVCLAQRAASIERKEMKVLPLAVKNDLGDDTTFIVRAENDLFIPRGSSERKEGDAIDTPLKLWDLEFDSSNWDGEGGRTAFIRNRDTHTFGIGVTVPKDAEPGKYTVTIYVDYEVSGEFTENSKYTQERPVKLFVTVP